MALFKRDQIWWYEFLYAGQRVRESAKTTSKTVAREAERKRRRELEESYNGIADNRKERIRRVSEVAGEYLKDYAKRRRSPSFAKAAVGHVTRLLGQRTLIEVEERTIRQYQTARLNEGASPKTINDEVIFLLRLLGEGGDALRLRLRKTKALKLAVGPSPGKAFEPDEQARLIGEARKSTERARLAIEALRTGSRCGSNGGSVNIYPAVVLSLNLGMRLGELRKLTWEQVDFETGVIHIFEAKTKAGERSVPLNALAAEALLDHARWYTSQFGMTRPSWFVFPGGSKWPDDPTRPVSTLATAWAMVKQRANVTGRWHDMRHTVATELCEAGISSPVVREVLGHVSNQMLEHYSHPRIEMKRKALDTVGESKRVAWAASGETSTNSVGVPTKSPTVELGN